MYKKLYITFWSCVKIDLTVYYIHNIIIHVVYYNVRHYPWGIYTNHLVFFVCVCVFVNEILNNLIQFYLMPRGHSESFWFSLNISFAQMYKKDGAQD